MQENPFAHPWDNQTTLHPLGLAAVVVLGVAMLAVRRRYAVVPVLIMACFVAPAQRIVVFGLDFNLVRVIVLFGWLRVFSRGEFRGFPWKPIDVVLVLWALSATAAYSLQQGTWGAFVWRLGQIFDTVGLYFLFRMIIRDWWDLDATIRAFAAVSIPVALAFLYERATRYNLFSVLGGVPEYTAIRAGKLRCQGAFSHPIIAGVFFATMMPLVASRWWIGPSARRSVVAGVASAGAIVIACASSTPVLAIVIGLVGACFFPLRDHLRFFRWGLLCLLIALHLVMNAPVWHLIARINVVGGSTGYHRYRLVDAFIRHFDEWWWIGTPSTAHWGPWLFDVTNQYVLEGVRGGLLTLVLFVALLSLAFQGVGRILDVAEGNRAKIALAWGLGVSMLMHCASFISISYFGQSIVVWYLVLGMIGSLTPGRAARRSSGAPGRGR